MASPLESDVAVLSAWWAAHAPTIAGDVRGLWFGIADLLGDDGVVQHTMYVAGTPDFDSDDGGDWACDYVWEPNDRYLRLDGLAAIELDDWVRAVEHSLAVVAAMKPWESGPPDLQGVGVGFDDGDIHIVWTNA